MTVRRDSSSLLVTSRRWRAALRSYFHKMISGGNVAGRLLTLRGLNLIFKDRWLPIWDGSKQSSMSETGMTWRRSTEVSLLLGLRLKFRSETVETTCCRRVTAPEPQKCCYWLSGLMWGGRKPMYWNSRHGWIAERLRCLSVHSSHWDLWAKNCARAASESCLWAVSGNSIYGC